MASFTDDERKRLSKENLALENQQKGAGISSGVRAVEADVAAGKTAASYAMALRPKLSLDTLAKRTNIDKTTLQGVLNGFPPKYLTASQSAAFKKALGISVKDATRPLDATAKACVLHSLPFPKEREVGRG